MNPLAAIASGVIGFITVAVVLVLMRHGDRAPQAAHPWLGRLYIVLMWAAGTVFAATGLESIAGRAVAAVTGFVGGTYAPLISGAIVIAALFLVAGTIVALVWAPDYQSAMIAVVVPLILGLTGGGVLHQLYTATVTPGHQLALALNSWLAG